MADSIRIHLNDTDGVTGLVYAASRRGRRGVTLVLGHGAGADQTSPFMTSFAAGLAARGVDVLTFNFLYTEQGRRAPDVSNKLEACYRAAIEAARGLRQFKSNRLLIGGKSLGGRIASQVAAAGVEGLAGLVFLGYPLHPPGKPEQLRAAHLPQIQAPMLFAQGTRDPFGTPAELRAVIKKLKLRATVYEVASGDHSFTVTKSSLVSQEEVYAAAQDTIAQWVAEQ
ncbi:MAG TPA: alpha/beta family hydrolase [Blastocatellia bacterium]|nr:alpha/beta family hydrolase [Blastocatellia bacterium]